MDTSISRRDARILLIIGIILAILSVIGWLVVSPEVATVAFGLVAGVSALAALALIVGATTLVRKR